MRVTSEIFVQALTRRVFGSGGFAAVARRGAAEAGAIFIAVRDRVGAVSLYGPAPQVGYDGERPEERRFILVAEASDDAAVEARLAREMRFDSDLWLLEVEPGSLPIPTLIDVMTP